MHFQFFPSITCCIAFKIGCCGVMGGSTLVVCVTVLEFGIFDGVARPVVANFPSKI